MRLTVAEVSHKGGRTYGYRVDDGYTRLAYLPDHAPAGGVSEPVRADVGCRRAAPRRALGRW